LKGWFYVRRTDRTVEAALARDVSYICQMGCAAAPKLIYVMLFATNLGGLGGESAQ
jgi:hypothetical protein